MLSLLDGTSSKGFAQRWNHLKVGEGQAEWSCGRWEGAELPCWGCAGRGSGWAGEEEQSLSFTLGQPVKFRPFP